MKILIAILFSFSAFATETIIIDSANITLSGAILKESITLVRNAKSPSMIEVTMPSHAHKECVKYEAQEVYAEASVCGSYMDLQCKEESYDCENRTRCTNPTELFGCMSEEWYQVCQYREVCSEVSRDMTCYHEAQVCVEYKDVPMEPKKVKLIFKLSKREAKNTHKIVLTLNPFNGLMVWSPKLGTSFDFVKSAWLLK